MQFLFLASSELTFQQIQNYRPFSGRHFDKFISDNAALVGHQLVFGRLIFRLFNSPSLNWYYDGSIWTKKIQKMNGKLRSMPCRI